MTKHLDFTGGVSVVGEIEVYDEDGVTPLTSYDFPNFTGMFEDSYDKFFFINNTGNVNVVVYWNISSSSILQESFTDPAGELYLHLEGGGEKYFFGIDQSYPSVLNYWDPNTEALLIPVYGGVKLRAVLTYPAIVVTEETFTMTVSFYASSG